LVLEVHRARGGSDKALSRLKNDLQARAFEAFRDHGSRHAVPFTDGDNLFT